MTNASDRKELITKKIMSDYKWTITLVFCIIPYKLIRL